MKRKTKHVVFAKGKNVSLPHPLEISKKDYEAFLQYYKSQKVNIEKSEKDSEAAHITGHLIRDGDTTIWLRKTECKSGYSIK